MKQSPCTPLCIELSICANFVVFEPLVQKLLNFKGFNTNKINKFNFILAMATAQGTLIYTLR